MKKILLACAIVVALCYQSWATVYYVDYVDGVDTNNGTATGTAFKHCPGDDNATGTAAATTLAAGDNVVFKGGVTYLGEIDLDWSGSAGSPITYDGNSAGSWGTGQAIINGSNVSGASGFDGSGGSRSYITIDGFTIKEMGGYVAGSEPTQTCTPSLASAPAGDGVKLTGGGSNVTIKNCVITEFGNWQNRQPFEDSAINGDGIITFGYSDVLIDNCTISKGKVGVSIQTATGTGRTVGKHEVRNSDISYVVWGVSVAPRGSTTFTDNILIHDNKIHDYEEYDLANWAGCGTKPHTDGIFLQGAPYAAQWTTTKIYNNKFYSTYASGGGTAAIYLSTGPSAYIYNNLFMFTMKDRPIAVLYGPRSDSSDQDVKVFNNTFFSNASDAVNLRDDPGARRTVQIRNNIFYTEAQTTGSIHNEDGTSAPDVLDNNVYFSAAGTTYPYYSGSSETLAQTQALGLETAGQATDPLFANVSFSGGVDVLSNDLTLQAASPAIDAGVPLGVYFETDLLGTIRPQGLGWDIGAYEYGSGAPDTTPAAFSFTDNTGVALSTTIYSTSVQVLAIDNGCSIALTGDASCRYQINGAGDWLASGDNVALNDNVALRATSSGSYSTSVSCTLNLGGVSDTWNVTTAAAVEVPESPRMRCGSMTGGWK